MDRSPQAPSFSPWSVGALALLLGAALLMYRPWMPSPFDILDFSEFLPLLRDHDRPLPRFLALVDYYAGQHGRFNVLSYAALALKWSLFGDHPVWWQVARFLQMSLAVVGVFWLLRRLDVSREGALAGATLFVAADSALEAWIRLTMGEPLGLMCMLGAAILATRYQDSQHWHGRAIAIAALMGGALLAKEMLVGLVPFVVLIALLYQGDGTYRWLGWNRRAAWLLGASAVFVGGTLLIIAIVTLSVPAEGFTALYGEANLTISRFLRTLRRMTLPANTYLRGLRAVTDPPNLIFTLLAGLGAVLLLRASDTRRRNTLVLLGAVLVPVTGALMYLPWPQYQSFYGLPFLFGPALLLGMGAGALARESRVARAAVLVGVALLVVMTGSIAQQTHGRTRASQVVNAAIADVLLDTSGADAFVVVTSAAQQTWQGTGATLRRYAAARRPGAMVPEGSEAVCDSVSGLVGNDRTVLVVVPQGACSVDGDTLSVLSQRYRFFSWRNGDVVTDSVWSLVYRVPPVAGDTLTREAPGGGG